MDNNSSHLPGAIETFRTEGHHPICAGLNGAGEPLYIADCMDQQMSAEDYETCCVTERARSVLYFDLDRRELRRCVGRFRVLVLAFNPPERLDAGTVPDYTCKVGNGVFLRTLLVRGPGNLLQDRFIFRPETDVSLLRFTTEWSLLLVQYCNMFGQGLIGWSRDSPIDSIVHALLIFISSC